MENMNPKEKAKSLLELMSSQTYEFQPYAGAHYHEDMIGYEAGKKCALIMIKGITTELNKLPSKDLSDLQYWYEVEYELILL
jgi:hypothetical protein